MRFPGLLLLGAIVSSNGQVQSPPPPPPRALSQPPVLPLASTPYSRQPWTPPADDPTHLLSSACFDPSKGAPSTAAMGQDADGNLLLTSVDGADIFLNGVPVVSPSTHQAPPAPLCQAGNKHFRPIYPTSTDIIGIIPADQGDHVTGTAVCTCAFHGHPYTPTRTRTAILLSAPSPSPCSIH